MNLLSKITNRLPFGKKEELPGYFFALNIGADNLSAALWSLKGKHLQVLETASLPYETEAELTTLTDTLLDKVLGAREIAVEKILFGIPDSWMVDDDLKDEYLKRLRDLVKELELQPMAYVASSHALLHFLERQEGVPVTAILVGFEQKHLTVTVARGGKIDGTKIVAHTSNSGAEVEKALLSFTQVETLPSKILIYTTLDESLKLEKIKGELLSFPWMSKLSFLHFPKIETYENDIEIKSVCFAGGFELDNDVVFVNQTKVASFTKPLSQIPEENNPTPLMETESNFEDKEVPMDEDLGFMVGDISSSTASLSSEILGGKEGLKGEDSDSQAKRDGDVKGERELIEGEMNEALDEVLPKVEHNQTVVAPSNNDQQPAHYPAKPNKLRFGRGIKPLLFVLALILILASLGGAYLFLPKATVKVFVEPKILEKDAEITADPKQKEIDQERKIIPGEIVETEISATEKGLATGTKEIGDPAKGVVVIKNKLDEEKTLSKGTVLTSSSGLKFSIDTSVTIASRSAEDGTFGKANADVVAQSIGANGNLPSGTDLTIAGFSDTQLTAKSEGNFSGGTSKTVTVVSDSDQKKLLAQVASNLRKEAQQKLQEKIPNKKVLEEALSEAIVKKSYSKNINDQANEFSLTLTSRYKGTAYDDTDLRQIVSSLVTTQVPEGFQLSLQDTETQADVSKLEDDGRLVFLARFRAKMVPKLDIEKIKKEIKGKHPSEAAEFLKTMDHILGSDITITPALPPILQNLPILESNINVEVGLK